MVPPNPYTGREQTQVKHFFLENYLERVAWNIFSFREEFVYVDGFSGPWESRDEAFGDTSFKLALDRLKKVRDGLRSQGKECSVRCFFNDSDPAAYEKLKSVKQSVQDIDIQIRCREFEDVVPEIVNYVGRSFSLTFIDPTGWTGFGLEKIRPVLELKGEVLINFMLDYVSRFLEHPRPEIAATFDPLFGGPDWFIEVEERVNGGESREDAIIGVYSERLRRIGRFNHVTSTRILKPLSDRSFFHLVYGTNHWKGLDEFRKVEKKALPKQEEIRGHAKQAHRVSKSGQSELFGAETTTGPLSFEAEREKRMDQGYAKLRTEIEAHKSLKYESLLGVVLEIPMVCRSDVNNWLKEMRADGEIEIPALTGRETTPKRGHLIIWKG